MAKGKKARAGARKNRSARAKDLDASKAKSVAGGKVALQDFHFTQTVNKTSSSL